HANPQRPCVLVIADLLDRLDARDTGGHLGYVHHEVPDALGWCGDGYLLVDDHGVRSSSRTSRGWCGPASRLESRVYTVVSHAYSAAFGGPRLQHKGTT